LGFEYTVHGFWSKRGPTGGIPARHIRGDHRRGCWELRLETGVQADAFVGVSAHVPRCMCLKGVGFVTGNNAYPPVGFVLRLVGLVLEGCELGARSSTCWRRGVMPVFLMVSVGASESVVENYGADFQPFATLYIASPRPLAWAGMCSGPWPCIEINNTAMWVT